MAEYLSEISKSLKETNELLKDIKNLQQQFNHRQKEYHKDFLKLEKMKHHSTSETHTFVNHRLSNLNH